MDWNWNSELTKHSITADPEVLRVLYERLQQQNAESKKVITVSSESMDYRYVRIVGSENGIATEGSHDGMNWVRLYSGNAVPAKPETYPADWPVSYYTDQTWRDQITIEDAQWLTSLGISPL